MDQDATWYGGTPRARRHCARWGPSSRPKKEHSPHVYCGQTAGCIPLGTEVGLGPGDMMLDGDPAPPPAKRGTAPQFSADVYCGQTVAHLSYC